MTCINISIFCQIEFVFQPILVEIPIAAVGVEVIAVEIPTSPKFETGYPYLAPRERKKNSTEIKSFFFFFFFLTIRRKKNQN